MFTFIRIQVEGYFPPERKLCTNCFSSSEMKFSSVEKYGLKGIDVDGAILKIKSILMLHQT